ncbi:GntR family transcriptional regulator [Ramlibacter aurantiacus]|uniref:GntR family transcriptional regulator n=1 Tax=Ramlibacter aurantiacus TaxID=2801330 RepID=UPI001F3DDAEB|nr:GntR family transcriptional regulator [Ramlibacter aurantiacus]
MELVDAAAEPGLSRYAAIAAGLRERIAAGEWPPGTALPSEQVLAAQQGVAMATLRRALELLAAQGLLERVHGRGTFVRASLAGAPMLRFFRFGDGSGEVPASRIVSRRKVAAPAQIAQRLGLAKGEPVLHLLRVRSLGGKPRLLEDLWLPLPMFQPLAELPIAQWEDLFYPMYAQRCGVHVQRATDEIGFGTLGAAQAAHLALPAGHPCARVARRAHDLAGRCVEVRTTLGDAHAFHYTVQIT